MNFTLVSSDFDSNSIRGHVDDTASKNVDDLKNLGPRGFRCRNLDENHFSLDAIRLTHVHHFEGVDKLAEVFSDLLENFCVSARDESDSGYARVLRHPHTKAVDIVAASAEQTCHLGENAEFVFHQNRYRMRIIVGVLVGILGHYAMGSQSSGMPS